MYLCNSKFKHHMVHANISIRIPDDYTESVHKFNHNMIHKNIMNRPIDSHTFPTSNPTYEQIRIKAGHLYTIYFRDNPEPSRLGLELILNFNDIESALNLICAGNIYGMSSNILSTYAENGISWSKCKPVESAPDDKSALRATIQYMFANGKWFYKNQDTDKVWIDCQMAISLEVAKKKKPKHIEESTK